MVRDLRFKKGGCGQRKRCSCSQNYQQGLLGNSGKVCMVCALGEDGNLNTHLIKSKEATEKQTACTCVHTNPHIFMQILYSRRTGVIWWNVQWHTDLLQVTWPTLLLTFAKVSWAKHYIPLTCDKEKNSRRDNSVSSVQAQVELQQLHGLRHS